MRRGKNKQGWGPKSLLGLALGLGQEFHAKLSKECVQANGCPDHGYIYTFGDGSKLHGTSISA
jgi:hypothetical protein